jgi:hypothetical protein
VKTAVASLCLVSMLLVTAGCAAPRATPEEVRASELAARASRSAAAAVTIPDSVTAQTKASCEKDLQALANASSGKYVHTVESVQFVGNVEEYNLRNRPHAYDIVVSYTVADDRNGGAGQVQADLSCPRHRQGGMVGRIGGYQPPKGRHAPRWWLAPPIRYGFKSRSFNNY